MNSIARDHPDGPRPSPAEPAASRWTTRVPREESGRLDVADQVVEKVAGHAVTLVPALPQPPGACWA